MNKNRLLLKVLPIIIFSLLLGQNNISAAKKEIDINTSNPSGYLFKVGNLKPGDWMPRDITILNEGTQDFRYMATLGKKKSVKGLLGELELIVKKDEKILYEGKLDKFKGFTPRELKIGSSEILFFQVTMPYDLGNAYQSAGAEVEILFFAEALGEPGDGDPPGPPGEEYPPDEEKPPNNESAQDDTNSLKDDKQSDETNSPGKENPSDNNTPPSNEGAQQNNTEEGTPEETKVVDASDKIIISPEMTENLLPNTAINTYNILLIGAGLLGCGSILFVFYFRRLRRDQ
ncbi:M73 family metallopeptidase [Bacillus sp. S/N-304-OC-R1]|uniref:M73 family metallopeptidase n=1 Tax=Bacillus sp. S/N-304-OC-R1 TaxID=2758034 RepID=UPI001C8E3EBD|nr:M73 family metallopeptidase [Bacillus sp. S/N-304-OC-R1]MBY0122945.1 hypothetical protein [Bacillus sp. S/N-304-OC-R1]